EELGLTEEELNRALDQWSEAPADIYQKGLAAFYRRQYAEANRYLSEAVTQGGLIERYVPLARVEFELAHYAAAESALRKVLVVHPEDPLLLNDLALVLEQQGRYTEAEPLFQRAVQGYESSRGSNHPDVATSLNNLALVYKNQ